MGRACSIQGRTSYTILVVRTNEVYLNGDLCTGALYIGYGRVQLNCDGTR